MKTEFSTNETSLPNPQPAATTTQNIQNCDDDDLQANKNLLPDVKKPPSESIGEREAADHSLDIGDGSDRNWAEAQEEGTFFDRCLS